jgi:hypothetical protein
MASPCHESDVVFTGLRTALTRARQAAGLAPAAGEAQAPIPAFPEFNIEVPGLGNLTFPTSFILPVNFTMPVNFTVPTIPMVLPSFNGTIPGLGGNFTLSPVNNVLTLALPPAIARRVGSINHAAGGQPIRARFLATAIYPDA